MQASRSALRFTMTKTIPSAPTTPAPDSANALLDATRDIFVNEGIKGLSVRRVAQQAGCTTMAVYSRFGGKEGLLGALFDEGFDRLLDAQRAVDAGLPAAARVSALCRAYRHTAQQFPHHYALMLGQFSGEHQPSPDSSAKAMATLQCLTDAVAACLRPAKTRSARAVEIANRLFAYCHGWVCLERVGFFGESSQSDQAFDGGVSALLLD
jgi:AcrR family transcriptional regulator